MRVGEYGIFSYKLFGFLHILDDYNLHIRMLNANRTKKLFCKVNAKYLENLSLLSKLHVLNNFLTFSSFFETL